MQEFQKELGQWRKDPAGSAGKKKPKYSYRTADELRAKGKVAGRATAASAGELAQVKVLVLFFPFSEVCYKGTVAWLYFYNKL